MNRNKQLKKDALDIINTAIRTADPFDSTAAILRRLKLDPDKHLTVFSIGKAAIPMARAAESVLGGRIAKGLGGHKIRITRAYYKSEILRSSDGGAPRQRRLTALLAAQEGARRLRGASVEGRNTARPALGRRQRAVREERYPRRNAAGHNPQAACPRRGYFRRERRAAQALARARAAGLRLRLPARVVTVALSDVLGNDRSVIASGITVREPLSDKEFADTVKKYLPEYAETLEDLDGGTDIKINDGGYYFAGDVEILCSAARRRAEELGYEVADFACDITGEARDVAAEKLDNLGNKKGKRAYIYGGETTVTLRGGGRGGRNQEMALAAAVKLRGRENIVFASAGSDGTDGPTDAAGGIADGDTYELMRSRGVDPEAELLDNNSYFALDAADSLIVTGPTGTNVNDITLILTDF